MDWEPAEFRKLRIRQFPPHSLRETAEGKFWKRFGAPVVSQQIGAVSHIEFRPQYPYNYAVTSSTRIVVFDAATRQPRRTFSRFKDKAYSGSYRSDGRLLVAGGESGIVQVFDAASRTLLRQLKGHQRPVHATRFGADRLHVLSGGDDATVRWWDVTMGEQVGRMDGHRDYVRTAAACPTSSDTWATGGYDHTVRLWDVRSKQGTMELQHGAPVEAVAWLPSGGLLAAAGGNSVTVWDVLSGGRLLAHLSNHQKTVTSLVVSPMAGPAQQAAPRLLTGSLDGHVKVYELDTFRVTHASKYPGSVLSLALSPDCRRLAVGQADGLLSVRKHAAPRPSPQSIGAGGLSEKRRKFRPKLTAANYRYFIRGQNERAAAGDLRIAAGDRARLAPYDRFLRSFRYKDALDAALVTKRAEVVASVVEELAARAGLNAALGTRNAAGVAAILEHVRRHICDPRHARQLTAIAHRMMDAYAVKIGASMEVDEKVRQLRERVAVEVRTQGTLLELQGALEPVLATSADVSDESVPQIEAASTALLQ